MRKMLSPVVPAIGAFVLLAPAWAGSLLTDSVNTCTTNNCSAMTLQGNVRRLEPFVVQVYAAEGECLRLDITAASQDLAMAVTAVDPYFSYFDDDRTEGDAKPLLKIEPVDATGWHTVHINHWDAASVDASFTLRYGRYPAGNANCTDPTPGPATSAPQSMISPKKAAAIE